MGHPAATADADETSDATTEADGSAGETGEPADAGSEPAAPVEEPAAASPAEPAHDGLPVAPWSVRKTADPEASDPGTGTPEAEGPEASEPAAGVPDETTVFPRILVTEAAAGTEPAAGTGDTEPSRTQASEPETSQPQASGPGAPETEPGQPETSEVDAGTSGTEARLPDETTVFFLRVPKTPPGDRPPDITRPQLILDDTMVDMAAVRDARKPGGPGSGGSRTGQPAPGQPPAGQPPAGQPPAGKPAPGKTSKKNRSVFGPEPAARPDMLTNAETVVMASVKDPKATPGESPRTRDSAAAGFAEAVTLILPAVRRTGPGMKRLWQTRVRRDRPAAQPPRRYTPGRRTTMISRLLLLAIVSLQAVLSLRLRNTAFEDESLYLYAGHMELQHLLHGTALQGQYAAYFSGSPVLYPVAAAFLNQLGGLALARALSLVEMLATTVLLYSMTRRLFNERIGLCAAAFFSVTESVVFLGNFATYDATCLSLLALAAWIMVRTAGFRWPVFLLAALPAALAVGVKYAGLLFVPTIAVLPVLAGWPERGRRVLWYPAAFGAAVAGLLYGALRLGGKAYMTAISSTTTNRAQGVTPDSTILREAAEWGGVLFVAAVIGTIAYVWRVRTEPEEKIAPAGGRFRRAALGALLTATALLAPAYQAHLHTDISFLKHIGFGLFFAAPMAGFGLARIMGDYFRRPQIGIAAWSLALVLGMVQSSYLFHQWPSSGPFVTAFAKYCQPHARYLVEVPEVPIYYLMGEPDAQPAQFTSTFFIDYFNKKGQLLTGPAGFTAAVQDGYFQVIAYSNTVTLAADGSLDKALKASKSYYLAQQVNLSDVFGPVRYEIWVKGKKPVAAAPGKKARKPKQA